MTKVVLFFDLEEAERPYNFNQESTVKDIIKVLDDHQAKAVFNTTGTLAEKYPNLIIELYSKGHEISNHSYNHEDCTQLSDEELYQSILKTQILIEESIGEKIIGFRSPRLSHDLRLHNLLQKMGYNWTSNLYHRFIELSEFKSKPGIVRRLLSDYAWSRYPKKPYLVSGVFEIPLLSSMDGELLGWIPPAQNSPINRIEYAFNSYVKQFDRIRDLFNLNFHPWIIGTGNRVDLLSKLLDYLSESEVEYMTVSNLIK